jgi:uncharacterized damage-inducible protein DinB
MKPFKEFRDKGAIGALLDEYERSIIELKKVITSISKEELIEIVDNETADENCKSIQTILSHVVESGYTYVIEIRKWLGEEIEYKESKTFSSIKKYKLGLDKMFSYNEKLFKDYPELQIAEFKSKNKIKVRWGQKYDVEQLLEHAIVHILRHRRQIERFQIKLKNKKS